MASLPIDSLTPNLIRIVRENSSVLKCDVELVVHCMPCGQDFLNPPPNRLIRHLELQRHLDFVQAFELYPEDQKSRNCYASVCDLIRRDSTRAEWLECREGETFCKLCERVLQSNKDAIVNHTRHHKIKAQRSNLTTFPSISGQSPMIGCSPSVSGTSQNTENSVTESPFANSDFILTESNVNTVS